MQKPRLKTATISPGDLYEDCSYHPCVCLGAGDGAVWGVSLVDGSYPRTCDIGVCGVRKLTPEEAWSIRVGGPTDSRIRRRIAPSARWWPARRGGKHGV